MAAVSEVCDFGWRMPDFTLATPTGKEHSCDGLMGPNGLLVAFICNHCPYVVAVIDRLASEMETLGRDGIGCVAIMSNDYRAYPADAPKKMLVFAQEHGLDVPYLVDPDQSVARAFDAVCTPDFFGFNAKGELQYRGRFDNLGMREKGMDRVPELLNAMQQVARTGEGPRDQTPSMGCSIKWA
jgi:peroxiredoxin